MVQELPSYEDFLAAAKAGNLLALSSTLNFDQETAITLADRFKDEPNFFLLESATAGPGGIARYSFLGFEPLATFALEAGGVKLDFANAAAIKKMPQDPMKALEALAGLFKLAVVGKDRQLIDGVDLCGMGGLFGFFGYEVASSLEPLVGKPPPDQIKMPQAHFFVPKNFLVMDQLCRKLTLIRYVYIEGLAPKDLKDTYETNAQALRQLVATVKAEHRLPELRTDPSKPLNYAACSHSISEKEFLEKVDRCMEEIRNGEIYQIQIGNRLRREVTAKPFDIFRHLRILNPSPYMAFYRFGKHHIICASPEMMVNVRDGKMVHRPIAGTRKRTWNLERDRKMKAELQTDEKERAEHIMLVDLSRNDIGRIAKPGSVTVDELMVVEEYSHVFHLVSQVSGDLNPGLSSFDAMIASFPNGTVSGAPKIRAMQLIAGLEPCSRQFYAGSLGVFDWRGNLKSTLLIRTIHVADGLASTQASAGIVYDSIPKNEWQETRNKMAACLIAMQNTL